MANLRSEFTASFERGYVADTSATRFPANAVASLLNARVEADATLSRREGTRRKHPDALIPGAPYGAIVFTIADGTDQMLAFVGTRAYLSEDLGETWDDVTPETTPGECEGAPVSLLSTGYYSFATMRVGTTPYLFCANGADEVWRWDGDAFDALPNVPTGVQYLAVFNDRLWVTGHSGILVQASKIADPETWTSPDGITVQMQTHDADVPTGMYQIGPHLLIFERTATSLIDGYGEQTIVVQAGATGISRSVGCIAFRTIAGIGDSSVCWLSERGIEMYTPGQGVTLLSRYIQQLFDEIDRNEIKENPGRPTACYDEQRQEYHLAVPTDGDQNVRTIVMSLRHRGNNWLGAPSVDQFSEEADVDRVYLAPNEEGYLDAAESGYTFAADADGYAMLVAPGDGDVLVDDDGYLDLYTRTALPAVMFMAPSVDGIPVPHSLGYDGFVREHYGVDKDDMDPDGVTGGVAFEMTVITRPFTYGSPRVRKRVREIHISVIADSAVTVSARPLVGGVSTAFRTISVPGTSLNQPRRVRSMTNAVGDTPQIEVRASDRVRIALVGVGADLLREP